MESRAWQPSSPRGEASPDWNFFDELVENGYTLGGLSRLYRVSAATIERAVKRRIRDDKQLASFLRPLFGTPIHGSAQAKELGFVHLQAWHQLRNHARVRKALVESATIDRNPRSIVNYLKFYGVLR